MLQLSQKQSLITWLLGITFCTFHLSQGAALELKTRDMLHREDQTAKSSASSQNAQVASLVDSDP